MTDRVIDNALYISGATLMFGGLYGLSSKKYSLLGISCAVLGVTLMVQSGVVQAIRLSKDQSK